MRKYRGMTPCEPWHLIQVSGQLYNRIYVCIIGQESEWAHSQYCGGENITQSILLTSNCKHNLENLPCSFDVMKL
jgi:hypothetical protein